MQLKLGLIVIFLALAFSLLQGCQNSANLPSENTNQNALTSVMTETQLRNTAAQFFKTYSKRQDFDAFLAFYSESIVLEDLVYGERVQGKSALKGFYRWHSGEVELIGEQALEVKEQLFSGNQVVTRGIFLPFYFHGKKMGPWRFVIWQEFDERGRIVKQFDWINYTPKETFIGGENLNGNDN